MQIEVTQIAKVSAKASFLVISRTLGFGFLGLLLNVALLILLGPEVSALLKSGGSIHLDGGGGPLAIIFLAVLVIAYWPVTLMVLGFVVGFPLVYFVLGQKHGVRKAIHSILGDHRELILGYTVGRLRDYTAERPGLKDKADAVITKSQIDEMLPRYLKRLDNVPRPLRAVARHYLAKIDLGGVVAAALAQQKDDAPLDFETISRTVRDVAARKLEEKLLKPDFKWLGILLAVNVAAFVVLKLAL